MIQGSWVCANDFICSYKSWSMVVYDSQYTFANMNSQNIFKITDLKIDSISNAPIFKALSKHIDLGELQNFRSFYSLWVLKVTGPVQVPLLFRNVLLKRTFFQKSLHSGPLVCSVKDVVAVKVSTCTTPSKRKVSNVNGSDWCHSKDLKMQGYSL